MSTPSDHLTTGDDATIASESGDVASIEELISYLLASLVDEPETIDREVERHGSTVQIRLNVPEDDLGKIIGRGGRIAKAMRTALMVAGSRQHLRVSLDIEGKPVA